MERPRSPRRSSEYPDHLPGLSEAGRRWAWALWVAHLPREREQAGLGRTMGGYRQRQEAWAVGSDRTAGKAGWQRSAGDTGR